MVESSRRAIVPVRNDNLLSGTWPRIRQRHYVDRRCVAVERAGGGRRRRLADDLNLTALNNDSLDGIAQECARLGAPWGIQRERQLSEDSLPDIPKCIRIPIW